MAETSCPALQTQDLDFSYPDIGGIILQGHGKQSLTFALLASPSQAPQDYRLLILEMRSCRWQAHSRDPACGTGHDSVPAKGIQVPPHWGQWSWQDYNAEDPGREAHGAKVRCHSAGPAPFS